MRTVITHGAREQLRIVLEHPDGTLATLTDAGLGAGANVDLRWSDDVSGDTVPTTAFSTLRQKQARGTWKLRVYDKAAGTTGTIDDNCTLELS